MMARWAHAFRSVFFFQAEDGIRDVAVTGVQTCALPILSDAFFLLVPEDQSSTEKRRTSGRRHVFLRAPSDSALSCDSCVFLAFESLELAARQCYQYAKRGQRASGARWAKRWKTEK